MPRACRPLQGRRGHCQQCAGRQQQRQRQCAGRVGAGAGAKEEQPRARAGAKEEPLVLTGGRDSKGIGELLLIASQVAGHRRVAVVDVPVRRDHLKRWHAGSIRQSCIISLVPRCFSGSRRDDSHRRPLPGHRERGAAACCQHRGGNNSLVSTRYSRSQGTPPPSSHTHTAETEQRIAAMPAARRRCGSGLTMKDSVRQTGQTRTASGPYKSAGHKAVGHQLSAGNQRCTGCAKPNGAAGGEACQTVLILQEGLGRTVE